MYLYIIVEVLSLPALLLLSLLFFSLFHLREQLVLVGFLFLLSLIKFIFSYVLKHIRRLHVLNFFLLFGRIGYWGGDQRIITTFKIGVYQSLIDGSIVFCFTFFNSAVMLRLAWEWDVLGNYSTFTISNRRAATLSQCAETILVVIVLETSILLFDLLFVKPLLVVFLLYLSLEDCLVFGFSLILLQNFRSTNIELTAYIDYLWGRLLLLDLILLLNLSLIILLVANLDLLTLVWRLLLEQRAVLVDRWGTGYPRYWAWATIVVSLLQGKFVRIAKVLGAIHQVDKTAFLLLLSGLLSESCIASPSRLGSTALLHIINGSFSLAKSMFHEFLLIEFMLSFTFRETDERVFWRHYVGWCVVQSIQRRLLRWPYQLLSAGIDKSWAWSLIRSNRKGLSLRHRLRNLRIYSSLVESLI